MAQCEETKTFPMGLVVRLRPLRRTPFGDARIGDTAAAPSGSELPGRPIAQATVGPILIVLTTPGLEDDCRLVAIREEFLVQALVAEAAVEALPVGVLPRAARVDVPGLRPPLSQPALQDLGDEFRPVVRAEPFRRPMLGERPLQDGDDPPGAERGPDLDRQALPREFIDQREDRNACPLAQ